jgi:hypothetical protein
MSGRRLDMAASVTDVQNVEKSNGFNVWHIKEIM